MPAPSRLVKLNPVCWLAAPSQPNTPAATPLSTSTMSATRSLPPSHPLRDTGRTTKLSEHALGLLRACGGDLAGGDEADQNRLDEEAHAEHGGSPVAGCSQLGEHLLDRARDRGACDFAMKP